MGYFNENTYYFIYQALETLVFQENIFKINEENGEKLSFYSNEQYDVDKYLEKQDILHKSKDSKQKPNLLVKCIR